MAFLSSLKKVASSVLGAANPIISLANTVSNVKPIVQSVVKPVSPKPVAQSTVKPTTINQSLPMSTQKPITPNLSMNLSDIGGNAGTKTTTTSMQLPQQNMTPKPINMSVAPIKPASPTVSAPMSMAPNATYKPMVNTPSGLQVNPSTGSVVGNADSQFNYSDQQQNPTVPQVPTVPQENTGNSGTMDVASVPDNPTAALESEYQKNLQLSEEEQAAQAELDKLQQSYRQGYQDIRDQAIPMQFITGQSKSLEDRALALSEPLQARLARAQAKRMSALEASKFALERADKQEAANRPSYQEIGGNLVKINPKTGKTETVFSAPAKPAEGFTLGEGERRYDAQGNLIASGANKITKDENLDRLLSVDEANKLGVPFGTTARQAQGTSLKNDQSMAQTTQALQAVNDLMNHPGLNAAVGLKGITNYLPGTDAAGFKTQLDRVKALLTLPALQQLRGLGAMSDREFATLSSSVSALSPRMSEKDFRNEMARIQQALQTTIQTINSKGQGGGGVNWSDPEVQDALRQGYTQEQIMQFMGGSQTSFNNVGSDTQLGALKQSLITQESGGDYRAIGVPTQYGRALGKYQVIPQFHFQKIGLNPNSQADQQRYLNSPELQDRLFSIIIDGLSRQYNGDARKIAAAYYGGSEGVKKLGTAAGNVRYQGGQSPSINEYVSSVISRIS